MKISKLATNISTSPIITFATEVKGKIANGENVFNLTIGDFDPNIYTIPEKLKLAIINAYQNNHTNYPDAHGVLSLRNSISKLIENFFQLDIDSNNILVACGSRPLIYSVYKSIVDRGDKVLFPVPSWNNDHYAYLSESEAIMIETKPENNFMPTKEELAPHLKDATLLALCSPQNPTGTVLSRQQLNDICQLVITENKRRGNDQKPLYVMFDQVYCLLTFQKSSFNHALAINPEMAEYAIFIDGMSKAFAGTGIRVGWATGPSHLIGKMLSVIAHLGSWGPKAEQVATGEYLQDLDDVNNYLNDFNNKLKTTLKQFHIGFQAMKDKGLPVDSIEPEASIYLSVRLGLEGKTTRSGETLQNAEQVQRFLLDEAKVAILPFSWFGAKKSPSWFRISIGTCDPNAVSDILSSLERSIISMG